MAGDGTWGIVTSGVSTSYVKDAIADLGIEKKVCLLKLGFTHPLPSRLILEFLERVDKVLVVEELEPYLEEGLLALAATKDKLLTIKGKGPGLFSRLYEYHPRLVRQVIADYFEIPYTAPAPPDPAALLGGPAAGAAAQPLPGLLAPGDLLCGEDRAPGSGDRRNFPHRYRLLHAGAAAALERGRLSAVHGVQRQHRGRHLPGHGAEGYRVYRRLHVFPLGHCRIGQRGAQPARFPAHCPGQRHHGDDRAPAAPRGQAGASRVRRPEHRY